MGRGVNGASCGPGHSAEPEPVVSALPGECPSRKKKNSTACGKRFELELVNDAKARGLEARRHYRSGQTDGSGDLTITSGWDQDWDGEAKWSKALPKWFVGCLTGRKFAAFKQSRGEKFVLIRWDDFLELLQ